MRTIKQKIFAALAALLFATLMLSAVFLLPKDRGSAYAARSTAFTEIGSETDDIYNDNILKFRDDLLEELYTAIAGVKDYNSLLSKVSGSVSALTSKDFRTQQGGTNNVSVWFGGKKWDVVYLTKARTSYTDGAANTTTGGDLILTLWQSVDNISAATTKWANRTTASNNPTAQYPDHMYSTSLMRVQTLNIGGYMSTSGSALSSQIAQNSNSEYARFTMSKDVVSNSVIDFLLQPKDMAYQETENAIKVTTFTKTLPNDAYGTPANADWNDGNNYKSKGSASNGTSYDSWKNDYIWLPSVSETGIANNAVGIWQTDASLRSGNAKSIWLRSGRSANANQVWTLTTTGSYASVNVNNSTDCCVRPAIHLNLTKVEQNAINILKTPTDITLDYNGSENTIEKAAQLGKAAWYDSDLYSSGVEITYSPIDTVVAKNYTVTLKITDDNKAWVDTKGNTDKTRTITMSVNPIAMTIKSDKQSELTAGYNFVYHTDGGGTHALKFPAANEADYIDLNAVDSGGSDKASLKIFYYIQTHDEKDHQNFVENTLPEIEKTLETLPDLSDGGDAKTGWVKYAADNASLNVNDVQGYCVFYKVTADNHKTLYGHFSVHIATEELKIYTDGNPLTESPVEFGSPDVPHKQEDLKKLAEAIITDVQDQNKESRLSSLDKTKFVFYLKNKDTGDEVHTIEDSGGEARWNAGTYELWVKYVDEGKSQFINFTWNSARPTLTIKPQEITLTWKGNDNWETDSAGASETVRDMDEFSWVYDGSSHNPTASFEDKYKNKIKPTVTITGEYINAQSYTATAPDVANYTFTNKTQTFKIVKAKNGWKDGKGYDRGDWSVGGKIAQEYVPEDLFGNTAKVYYYKAYSKEDGFSQQYTGDFSDIKEPTVFYVQILIEPDNDNYDGIEEMKSFQITVCTRHEAKAGEYGHNEQGHWTICKFCGEQIESEPQPHAAEDGAGYSSDESQHWQTCKTCGVEFGRENHIAKEGDGALGHDSSQHWNICQTCNKDYDKVAHSYTIEGNITKNPNCTESGTKQYKCVCGEIEERDIDPTGHTAKAGWQSDGSQHWQVCSTCSEIIEESRKNHSWAYTPQVDPKCTAPGHTEFWKCSDCEKLREDCKDEDIDPIPHTFGAEKERREPTCTQPGSETGMCTMCQNRVTNILPATGHSYAEKIERAATCTLAGSKIEECTACHEMKPDSRVSIPMTEHTYGTWNTLLAATCEDSGTDQHACTACGHKEERTVQPLGHSMQRHAQKDATETAAGNIEYYECSKCHKYYDSPTGGIPLSATDIVIPALGSGNMSTGGGGDDGFFKNNWWWIMLIALAILIILLIVWIISSSRARRRERERDRQFEALLKMQMMHYGFGMGGYQNAAENDAAFTEKQQPAQLPYTQEMIDVAVAAAMSAMQRMNASKPDGGNPPHDDNNGGESANDGGGNGGNGGNGGDDDGFVDDFGFYDEYKP